MTHQTVGYLNLVQLVRAFNQLVAALRLIRHINQKGRVHAHHLRRRLVLALQPPKAVERTIRGGGEALGELGQAARVRHVAQQLDPEGVLSVCVIRRAYEIHTKYEKWWVEN